MAARFGRTVVDHRTWVIAGDGCLMEGISHEAIGLAGMQKLDRLTVMWDDNGISIDGKVELSDITDQMARFAASGWSVHACDGHDPDDIDRALREAVASPLPAFVACKTHIGFGAPTKQDTKAAHGSPLGAEEIAKVREIYGWSYAPFEIPDDVREAWSATGARGASLRRDWEARLGKLPRAKRAEFERVIAGTPPRKLVPALTAYRKAQSAAAPKVATRKASEMALEVINAVTPETLGGSADLTGSNNTLTKGLGVFAPGNRGGRYLHYGIREHGMAAAMNGLALHGGVIPYGGTFLVFADYARGAMRLSCADGRAGDLCADPRLDRARRGRPDPPAGRAAGDAAGDAEPQRVPPRRRDRDRRGLGDRADHPGPALGAGADPTEPRDASARCTAGRTSARAAPTCWPRRRDAAVRC